MNQGQTIAFNVLDTNTNKIYHIALDKNKKKQAIFEALKSKGIDIKDKNIYKASVLNKMSRPLFNNETLQAFGVKEGETLHLRPISFPNKLGRVRTENLKDKDKKKAKLVWTILLTGLGLGALAGGIAMFIRFSMPINGSYLLHPFVPGLLGCNLLFIALGMLKLGVSVFLTYETSSQANRTMASFFYAFSVLCFVLSTVACMELFLVSPSSLAMIIPAAVSLLISLYILGCAVARLMEPAPDKRTVDSVNSGFLANHQQPHLSYDTFKNYFSPYDVLSSQPSLQV